MFELPSRKDVSKCVITKERSPKGLKPTLVTSADGVDDAARSPKSRLARPGSAPVDRDDVDRLGDPPAARPGARSRTAVRHRDGLAAATISSPRASRSTRRGRPCRGSCRRGSSPRRCGRRSGSRTAGRRPPPAGSRRGGGGAARKARKKPSPVWSTTVPPSAAVRRRISSSWRRSCASWRRRGARGGASSRRCR